MDSISLDHRDQHAAATTRTAIAGRALRASLLLASVIGGGYLWQHTSSTRTAHGAEQARIEALQITPRKMQALEREAEIAAAAKAFAQRMAAEKALREAPPAAYATGTAPRGEHDSHI